MNGSNVTVRGDTAATAASATGVGGSDLSVADPDLSALDGETVSLSDSTNTVSYTFTNSATGRSPAFRARRQRLHRQRHPTPASTSAAPMAPTSRSTSNASIDAVIGIAGATTTTNGVAAFDATAATVEADFDNAGITGLTASVSGGQVSLSLN